MSKATDTLADTRSSVRYDVLKLIIDQAPDPNPHLNIANAHGRTALIHASMEGNRVAVDRLLEQNVHVNTTQ